MNHTLLKCLFAIGPRLDANLRSGEGIGRVTVPGVEVDGDSIRHGGDHKSQGHDHGGRGAVNVSHSTSQGRDDGAAEHTTDDQSGTALRVATQSAHAQGDDGGEADRFEEENNE